MNIFVIEDNKSVNLYFDILLISTVFTGAAQLRVE